MAKPIVMPQVGQDLEEGKLVEWKVKLGDKIKKGDIVAVVESEKASFEVEAYEAGTVVTLVYDEGATTKVLAPLLFVEADAEASKPAPEPAAPAPSAAAGTPRPAGGPVDAAAVVESEVATEGDGASAPAGRNKRSSPLARRTAGAAGLDLGQVGGTGPRGAVVMRDVQQALKARGASAEVAQTPRTVEPPRTVEASPTARFEAPAPAAPAAATPAPAASGASAPLHRAWLRKGEGDPVVMIHGFGADHNSWRVLAAAANLSRPILAIDLPGHGRSSATAASLGELASAVAAAIEEEGVAAADLVGHSLGAAVAVAVAEAARFRVRSLFLLSPAGLGPDINGDFLHGFTRARSEAALAPWMRLLVADEAAVGAALVRVTAETRAQPGVAGAQERMAEALFPDGTQAFDVRRALGGLPMPVRVVFGAADRIVPARHAVALPGTVAVHTLPGIGHMPFLEARDIVARILGEHLRSAA